MKKFIIPFIIVGATLLTAGAIVFAVGISNYKVNGNMQTNTYDLDQSFNKFNFDLDVADVEFRVSDNDKSQVICEEKEKQPHEVKVSNDTLYITASDQREWYEKAFDFNYKPQKVTVYMPAKEYDAFLLKSSTGNLKMPNDFSFASGDIKESTGNIDWKANVNGLIKVETSTGGIALKGIKADKAEIKASTGNVLLEQLEVSQKIDVKTSTGNIAIKETTARDLETKCSTGHVALVDTVITESIKNKTGTGDVGYKDSDAKNIDIETDTGDVVLELLTKKMVYYQTDTGKVRIPKLDASELADVVGVCNITTDTGDITVSFK